MTILVSRRESQGVDFPKREDAEPSASRPTQGRCYPEDRLPERSLILRSLQGCRLMIGCVGEGVGSSLARFLPKFL